MFKNLARRPLPAMFAAAAASFTLSLTYCGSVAAQAPTAVPAKALLKVAFVLPSPVGQAGWSYQHDQGRRAMEAGLGAQVASTVVESVAEGPDSERVMRDLALQGHRLIFAASFGYLEPVLRVAAEFPQVRFEHAGGYKTAANVNTYNARYYEARYLAGVLAGKTSRSGVAGYVAGFPVPEVVQGINAFTIGMRAANPAARVRVIWLNTWFDPAREREAALTLVHQGADVLTNHSGSTAVAQVAQEHHRTRGVNLLAYQSDMRSVAPDAQLAAVTHHWGSYYTEVARAVLQGRWASKPVWGGMKDGLVQLTAVHPRVPPGVRDAIEAQRQAIVAGRLKPFAAPLIDSEGQGRLAKGELDDAAISRMNWFVQGVVGAVPRS